MTEALTEVSKFGANMGGTEIYSPMQQILKAKPQMGMQRQVFLLTDGAVGNAEEIIELINFFCYSNKNRN